MDSKDWANYVEATDGLSKPWLLIQWRLKLLQEQRSSLDPAAYTDALAELHGALMNLGEWWQGQEQAVFGLFNTGLLDSGMADPGLDDSAPEEA